MLYDGTTASEQSKAKLTSKRLHKYTDEIKWITYIQMPIHIFLAPLLYFVLLFYFQLL
jgi:hypothetical protein